MPPIKTQTDWTPSAGELRRLVNVYANSPIFASPDDFVVSGNPFRRPVRAQDADSHDFAIELSRADFLSSSALTAQRLLLNIYESELMFLPNGPLLDVEQDFRHFYSGQARLAGDSLRPVLEQHLFGFLDREVDVSGPWTKAAMHAYFDKRLDEATQSESAVCAAILASGDPAAAAGTFLIQLAGDFLTEASAMARNVLGNYGPALSELFKVLIDEYGYGVHATKHSTMFEDTLTSRGLLPDVRAYWQFYLTSSLTLTNYFHYISRNHTHFFRYLGALYYTESTLPHANRQQARMLSEVFGDRVDVRYFDEHVHIDKHHSRMVLEKLINPVVERCGEGVILDIVRGFEEFRLLQGLADADLISQIAWADSEDAYRQKAQALMADGAAIKRAEPMTFREPEGEVSVTHVHDEDELFDVESGEIDLMTGLDRPVRLCAGDGYIIPRARLHGSVVISEECRYAVRPIRSRQAWSS